MRGNDRKQQSAKRQGTTVAPMPTAPGFGEVPPPPTPPQVGGGLEVALHRTDGARLRMYSPDASRPLAAIVRSLLEA